MDINIYTEFRLVLMNVLPSIVQRKHNKGISKESTEMSIRSAQNVNDLHFIPMDVRVATRESSKGGCSALRSTEILFV